MFAYINRKLAASARIALLIAPIWAGLALFAAPAQANPEVEITPQIETLMIEAAQDLLIELEEAANIPEEKRASRSGRFRTALLAAGKDQVAVALAFSERLTRRYPEALPGLLAYNVIKFGMVVPLLAYTGYPEAAALLATLPDTFLAIFAYAATRLPYDIIRNRVRNGYWFQQIFSQRDERLGLSSTNRRAGPLYWSSYWRFQFYNINIPVEVVEGETRFESVTVPMRRIGALSLADEILSINSGDTNNSDSLILADEIGNLWLNERGLANLVSEEMGDEDFKQFYLKLVRKTSDARLRQVILLQWLLKNSSDHERLAELFLRFRSQSSNPVAKMLATIELVRSEIRFFKRESRISGRETRRELLNQTYSRWVDKASTFARQWYDDLLAQSAHGTIIRQLNRLEIELIAADLKGDKELLNKKMAEVRSYITAMYLEHLVNATEDISACSVAIQ